MRERPLLASSVPSGFHFYGIVIIVCIAISANNHRATASPLFQRSGALDGQALYNASDDVISLSASKFQADILNQEYGSLVEFYNAFCGHCQRFAPYWKEFATDVRDWRGIVQVAAVDCANDANTALCREYEIMSYPSLRYFGPHLSNKTNYGTRMNHTNDLGAMRRSLTALIRNGTEDGRTIEHWPTSLALGAEERALVDVFAAPMRWPERVRFAFVVYEPVDSWMASEIALDLHSQRSVVVQRVHSAAVASTYGLPEAYSVAMINRQLEVVPMTLQHRRPFDRKELRQIVQQFLRQRELIEVVVPLAVTDSSSAAAVGEQEAKARITETIAYVKAHEPTVYWADLERAIWYSLSHEVTQFAEIDGDRLEALKRYVAVLSR